AERIESAQSAAPQSATAARGNIRGFSTEQDGDSAHPRFENGREIEHGPVASGQHGRSARFRDGAAETARRELLEAIGATLLNACDECGVGIAEQVRIPGKRCSEFAIAIASHAEI